VHNIFAIASRITFLFMNYGRQWVQIFLCFCIASVLLQHTELLPHVCLAVFPLRILIHRRQRAHGRHNVHSGV